VLADPETVTRLTNIGSEPFAGSPADFEKFIAAEIDKWGKVVRFASLKVE
jgi:tripartite-type tricarboxylate transporter receptor subunit TctC